MADAAGKNFRKGISLIELFQFKIFIFFSHSPIFCRCLFSESKSTRCAVFFFKTSAYKI